jgi:hypothetical protein
MFIKLLAEHILTPFQLTRNQAVQVRCRAGEIKMASGHWKHFFASALRKFMVVYRPKKSLHNLMIIRL